MPKKRHLKPSTATTAVGGLTTPVTCIAPGCNAAIPQHSRSCVVCGNDAGFPNVRAASATAERAALQHRYDQSIRKSDSNGTRPILDAFRTAVHASAAVLCRPLGAITELLSSDNQLYASYYQLIAAWARLPEDNKWDAGRQSVDALLFPYYFDEVRFAALSLNGKGVTGYGGVTLVLRDVAIRNRATVFEANSFEFINNTLHVPAGGPLPVGYRATWDQRDLLAVAKLSPKFTDQTTADGFPSMLLSANGTTTADFIEVHIYGPLHRLAVEKMTAQEPKRNADKVLLKAAVEKLQSTGASIEIYK